MRPTNAGGNGNSRNSGLQEGGNPYGHNYQRNRNLTMHNGLAGSNESLGGGLLFNTTNDGVNQNQTYQGNPKAGTKGHAASHSAF
jgi:hypothetical protein